MTTRPFRFGVVTVVRGGASVWADAARRIEDLGYATILVPDTLATPSPFLALTAAATATTALKVGSWVLNAPLRTPAHVVREAVSLRELAGGRFELGLGAGRPGGAEDADALGVEWGTPGARVDRVAATADAVLATVDPPPPIVIAGSGPRMLALAGRVATTLALPLGPTASVQQLADVARRALAAGPDLELSLQIASVGDDIPAWLRDRGMTPEVTRDSATALTGDPGRDVDRLQRLRADHGVSYVVVSYQSAQALGPVVERLAGR